jgi:alkylation response protein AidB-like acyl-CoA dehydrogenase
MVCRLQVKAENTLTRGNAMSDQNDAASAREAAEQARQKKWTGASFLRELFMGRTKPELLFADDDPSEPPARAEFSAFYEELRTFLHASVDPAEIDETGEYPEHVLDGLARLGAFGMKIPREYGGLGLTHREYVRVMEMLGSYDANITALLSAHQAIGVPHPVQMFGSEELKRKYLPRCARGAISAFALTESSVGSDPSKLATVARPSPDGTHFILDGEKMWCTNGTLASVIIVLARNPENGRISCFVVEMQWEGVRVEHRCHFMGLHALGNGVLSFNGVRVPRENLVGEEGSGLRVALATLNTGRLTLPAATAGGAMRALEICRKWANARAQWGQPIGKHEAIAAMLADMTTSTYAMESVAEVVGALADRPDRDIRLEAAAAKEWNTTRGWHLIDQALQIRGGRGYETERSLRERGEAGIGIERMLRDARINRIFEGSSEIMHLFIAREAVDTHLDLASVLIDPKASWSQKLAALPGIAWFYARWYPALWLGFVWARYHQFGALGAHLRFVDRASRRLARAIFHGMLRFGPGLEKKQAFLFRAVDVALELFTLTCAIMRARRAPPGSRDTHALVARLAFATEKRVDDTLRDMWRNDDAKKYALSQQVLQGHYAWLEQHAMPLPFDEAGLRPPTMEETLAARRNGQRAAPPDAAARGVQKQAS